MIYLRIVYSWVVAAVHALSPKQSRRVKPMHFTTFLFYRIIERPDGMGIIVRFNSRGVEENIWWELRDRSCFSWCCSKSSYIECSGEKVAPPQGPLQLFAPYQFREKKSFGLTNQPLSRRSRQCNRLISQLASKCFHRYAIRPCERVRTM